MKSFLPTAAAGTSTTGASSFAGLATTVSLIIFSATGRLTTSAFFTDATGWIDSLATTTKTGLMGDSSCLTAIGSVATTGLTGVSTCLVATGSLATTIGVTEFSITLASISIGFCFAILAKDDSSFLILRYPTINLVPLATPSPFKLFHFLSFSTGSLLKWILIRKRPSFPSTI